MRLGAGPSSATLVNLHIVRRVALSQANIWSNDFQEGRLAGAVLADKPDDLSRVEVQSYLRKRRLSGESLADSLEVKDATDGGFLRWGLLNMDK
jgi:hypothetical protein